MELIKKWLLLFVVFLSACQVKEPTTTFKGYIADINHDRILVGDIFFSLQEAEIVTDRGKSIKYSDLQIGNEVIIEFNGIVAESLPGQASAEKLTVVSTDNEISQEAVKAIVDYVERKYGKPVIIKSTTLSADKNQFAAELMTLTESGFISLRYDSKLKIIFED